MLTSDVQDCCRPDFENVSGFDKRRSEAKARPPRTSRLHWSKFFTNPRGRGSSLWLLVLIMHSFVNFSKAQDSIGLELHRPYDFDSDFEDLPSNFLDPGDDDDFSRKNMRLFAVTGHLFNRSLVEELKAFDPNVLSDGDAVKVHFPKYDLPDSQWLVYKSDASLLQGVPTDAGRNNFYITIIHVNAPSQSALTLPCSVEVISEERGLELKHNYHASKLKVDLDLACAPHDPVTIAIITLSAKSQDVTHLHRIHCVERLRRFFDLSPQDVTFHNTEQSLKRDITIQSGPGNVPKRKDDSETVSLSWELGCSSDIIGEIPSLEKLEASALDGSLAQAIGYDVTGWKILNKSYRFKRLDRVKRQSGTVPSSAAIFHPPARKLPISGDNVKIMEEFKNEEILGHLQLGRTRVAVNAIHATPVVQVPVRATRLSSPPSRSRSMIPPSTPSVAVPSVLPDSLLDDNQPPMMFFGMTDIHAIMHTYIEVVVPNEAIYDAEDGMTEKLNLELLDAKTNEDVSTDQTWIMFDTEDQLVYGVPDETAVKERELVLVARDSGGKSASIPLFVYVDLDKGAESPSTHKFTFIFSRCPDFDSKNKHYTLFGKKLTPALAFNDDIMSRLTMVDVAKAEKGRQCNISWYDREWNRGAICNSKGIKDEANLMIGDDASPGRNKPAKEFAAKFSPEYKLRAILINLLGPCEKHTTTSTTSTSTSPTTTTETSTVIPTPQMTTSMTSLLSSTSTATLQMTSPKESQTKSHARTTPKISTPPISPLLTIGSLPAISAQAGKVTRYILPSGTFVHPTISEKELKLQFAGNVPGWVALDSDTSTLYLMATLDDCSSLEPLNATYGMWSGKITAEVAGGPQSKPLTFKVFVRKTKNSYEDEANHRFFMTIKNYNLTNFGGMDRLHLLNTIVDVFGDKDTDNIRFYPIRSGSIIFSWFNSSLSHIEPCPYKEISTLSEKVFEQKKLKPEIQTRFQENGFELEYLRLTKTPWCKVEKNVPATTEINVGIAGHEGKSTTIIIIVVIVICLGILIIILVVKCRMGQKEKDERDGKLAREEAVIAAGSPDASQTPRIKKGIPIIFQDELSMEPNGNTNASSTTPLMSHRNNGNAKSPAVAEDDENIHEETQFITPTSQNHPMTPPTPIMSDRPPPPYRKSR